VNENTETRQAPKTGRIVYARGAPYGAPLVMVRGGATRRDDVKAILRARGFRWNDSASAPHSYSTYLDRDEFADVLRQIAELGIEVVAKNERSVVPGFEEVK